jgi:hypothetical protein
MKMPTTLMMRGLIVSLIWMQCNITLATKSHVGYLPRRLLTDSSSVTPVTSSFDHSNAAPNQNPYNTVYNDDEVTNQESTPSIPTAINETIHHKPMSIFAWLSIAISIVVALSLCTLICRNRIPKGRYNDRNRNSDHIGTSAKTDDTDHSLIEITESNQKQQQPTRHRDIENGYPIIVSPTHTKESDDTQSYTDTSDSNDNMGFDQ